MFSSIVHNIVPEFHDAGGRLENLLSSCGGEKGEHTDVDESRPGVLDSRVEFLFPVRDERRLLITRYRRTNRFKGNGFEAISDDKTSRRKRWKIIVLWINGGYVLFDISIRKEYISVKNREIRFKLRYWKFLIKIFWNRWTNRCLKFQKLLCAII